MMRDSDTVARLGGDEFVILAEDLDSDAEALAARRTRAARAGGAVSGRLGRGGDARERRRIGLPRPGGRPRGPAARGRRGDVPGQARRRAPAGAVRREACAARSTRAWTSRIACAMPCPGRSCCSTTSRSCRWRAGARSAARRSCAGIPTAASRRRGCCPGVPAPAEESELIVQIGDWVLHAACAQAAAWRREGIAIPISVNVSARELTEGDLAERVQRGARSLPAAGPRAVSGGQRGGDPARPRAGARGAEGRQAPRRRDRARQLRRRQSSLSLPRSLPLDMLKLDRTLIGGFERDKDKRAMVAATVALAQRGAA